PHLADRTSRSWPRRQSADRAGSLQPGSQFLRLRGLDLAKPWSTFGKLFATCSHRRLQPRFKSRKGVALRRRSRMKASQAVPSWNQPKRELLGTRSSSGCVKWTSCGERWRREVRRCLGEGGRRHVANGGDKKEIAENSRTRGFHRGGPGRPK